MAHAIEAILEQQYPGEFEVILALGPSRDRTNEIAEKLRAQDSRVVLVESPTGRTAAGLNLAIKKSRFNIICRIDGHAEVSRTYIRDAVEIMEETKLTHQEHHQITIPIGKYVVVHERQHNPLAQVERVQNTWSDSATRRTVNSQVED